MSIAEQLQNWPWELGAENDRDGWTVPEIASRLEASIEACGAAVKEAVAAGRWVQVGWKLQLKAGASDTSTQAKFTPRRSERGRAYLAGPMRGVRDHNFPAFDAAAKRWREAGYDVSNPAEMERDIPGTIEESLTRDVAAICRGDALVLLSGWADSRGARAEVLLGLALDPPRKLWDGMTMQVIEPGDAIREIVQALSLSDQTDKNLLEDAQELVYGSRRRSYGHPRDDYKRTAALWSTILGHEITSAQAIMCMIAVKLSRECHQPSYENRVDMAGYAACLDLLAQRDSLDL